MLLCNDTKYYFICEYTKLNLRKLPKGRHTFLVRILDFLYNNRLIF